MQTILQNPHKLRILTRSAVAITSVVVVEVLLGLAVGSLAIVSDGLHALLDSLATFGLLIATRASLKPPDEEHMYGHEKFESIGGFVGGITLVGTAALVMYEATLKIVLNEGINARLELVGWIAIGYTFCIDFLRIVTFRYDAKNESSTVRAGFYHALADLSSTVIAFLGFGLATIGIYYGDAIASMILSILLGYLSVRLIWSSGMELSDSVTKEVTEKVRKGIRETQGFTAYKNLRVRRAGEKTFVEATIQVPDYMNLDEGHALASKIEKAIRSSLGNAEVIIHVEPPPETEITTEKLVGKLASEIEGVKEAHEISAVCEEGKLYVTLHAYVDPKISLKEAQEKAEKIEKKIIEKIKDVENVAVHIEPYSARKHVGTVIGEDEIRKTVNDVLTRWPETFRVRGITTYVAHKKRYINMKCRFSKQISLEDAHTIVSEIEDSMHRRFAETVVTVQIESD